MTTSTRSRWPAFLLALAPLVPVAATACDNTDEASPSPSNTAGSAGANTAGNGGANTAGSAGANTAGSAGANAAGNGGANTAGSAGANTAGSAGANNAGNGGANTAGSGGANTAGNGGAGGSGVVLFEDFEEPELPVDTPIALTLPGSFAIGSSKVPVVVTEKGAYGGKGRSLKATYPSLSGDEAVYPYAGFDLSSYDTNRVRLRFRAKMPGNHHGLKFVKVFGKNDGATGYANATFGLDYTGVDFGSMYCVSYGDGAALQNDTASILGFADLGYPGRAGKLPGFSALRPHGKRFASADWGTTWHLFELYAKFNTGSSAEDEKNDGAFFVKIDDEVYLDAKGVFNRNPKNGNIDRVEILGWSQTAKDHVSPSFEIWYDDIEISLD
jgi:hypothetical protein